MYTLHPASLPPYDAELSRRAAARHAVLAAVKERRSRLRHPLRRPRSVPARFHVRGTVTSPTTPRC